MTQTDIAKAVLLFFRGGAWTPKDHENWKAWTGTVLATKANLLSAARKAISDDRQPTLDLNPPGEVRQFSSLKPSLTTETETDKPTLRDISSAKR